MTTARDHVEAVDAVRDQAVEVGRGWSGAGADPDWSLVAALFHAVASDDDLLGLAAEIPPDRLPALLFLASIQRVVAEHPDEALAAYYPGPAERAVDAELAPALRSFALNHADEVRSHFDRHYQMNEVGRCAQVGLALGVVQGLAPGRPLALIDVGAGAGLGLHVDRYRVDLDDGRSFGPIDSPVRLSCAVSGRPPLPEGPPAIGQRVGLDVAPIDLDDDESRAWLAACIPPTPRSLERLAAAVELTRAAGTTVQRADGPGGLATAIDAVPDELLVVVVDSYTAVFFDDADRRAMATCILGRQRDGVWISLDPLVPLGTTARRCVQDLPVDPALVARNAAGGVFALLSLLATIDGRRRSAVLATAHPSGTRMDWLSTARVVDEGTIASTYDT